MAFIDLQVVALLNCYMLKGSADDPIGKKRWWHRSANGSCADKVQKHNMNDQNGIHSIYVCHEYAVIHIYIYIYIYIYVYIYRERER